MRFPNILTGSLVALSLVLGCGKETAGPRHSQRDVPDRGGEPSQQAVRTTLWRLTSKNTNEITFAFLFKQRGDTISGSFCEIKPGTDGFVVTKNISEGRRSPDGKTMEFMPFSPPPQMVADAKRDGRDIFVMWKQIGGILYCVDLNLTGTTIRADMAIAGTGTFDLVKDTLQ